MPAVTQLTAPQGRERLAKGLFVEICLGFVFLSTITNYKWLGATPDSGKVQTLLLLNSWATDDKINIQS